VIEVAVVTAMANTYLCFLLKQKQLAANLKYIGQLTSSVHKQALVLSPEANTVKIILVIDSDALPIKLILTGSGVHDSTQAHELIER